MKKNKTNITEQKDIQISSIVFDDLIDVFNLSNQDTVRVNSFNNNKIDLEEHKKWFKGKLEDKNVIILKAVVNNELAGQVRLDLEDNDALIGVSVDEKFRGEGIASKLLQAAIAKIESNGRIKTISAFVKPENLASIRLFEKNGFVFDREDEVLGNNALRYKFNI
jgi:RimJ/RimL family protein N-acetyltransferase